MSTENTISMTTIKKVYDVIYEIIKLEEIFQTGNDIEEKCYLVGEGYFDGLKKRISYDKLKQNILGINKKIISIYSAQNIIRKYIDFEQFKYVTPCEFKKSHILLNELFTKNKQYYIININLANRIFKKNQFNQIDEKEREISYKIKNKKIYIYLKEKDYLEFEINNKGIIGISNLIGPKKILQNYGVNINQNESSSQKENNDQKNISNNQISDIKIEYKKHLEILMRLLIYQNEKKEKINNFFADLNEQKKESVFLVNSDWIEKFKYFFESEYINSYLNNKYKSNINSNDDDKIFEEVIANIPGRYFNKLNEKIQKNGKFNNKLDNISQENFKVKTDKSELNITYFCNFQIINQKIFGLLMTIVEDLDLNKCDLYQIGNEKFLLKFPNGICDEIGIINDKNIFIPEYILYSNKEINDLTLNIFFKTKFNTTSKNNDKLLPIKDKDKSLIGYCLSIEYTTQLKMKQEIKENSNAINVGNDEDENENNSNSPTSKTNGHNNINNQNNTIQNNKIKINSYLTKSQVRHNSMERQNNKKSSINNSVHKTKEQKDKKNEDAYLNKFINNINMKNKSKKGINNSMNIGEFNISDVLNNEKDKEMKNIITSTIEIILLMKKFEKEIDVKINESSGDEKKNIEKCILLKKEWINKFKKSYINEEIESYLNSNIISDDIIVDIEYIYSNRIKNKKDYIKNINENKIKFSSNDLIKYNTTALTQLHKNNDIYYPKDFYIINKSIYEKLIKLYKIDNSKEIKNVNNNMINYIINNGKIIFSYQYYLNGEENKINYYNILICEKDINNLMEPIIIQCFEENEIAWNSCFNKYSEINPSLGKNVGDIDDGIIVKRPLKEAEIDYDLNILITLFMAIIQNRKKLEKKLNQSLKVSKEEEYYIVNKNWMEEFLNFFEFKKFNSLRKENKVSEYDKVFSILKNDEIISKKIKEKNKFINTKYLTKNKMELGNITHKYYDNLEIINEEIKQSIEELIKINIESKANILFGDNKVFIYNNKDNFLLLGRLNNDSSFTTYILMMLKDHKYIDLYIDNFKINKFEDVIKNFKGLSVGKFSLLSGQLGVVYKINIDFEIEEILKTVKNQINKDMQSKTKNKQTNIDVNDAGGVNLLPSPNYKSSNLQNINGNNLERNDKEKEKIDNNDNDNPQSNQNENEISSQEDNEEHNEENNLEQREESESVGLELEQETVKMLEEEKKGEGEEEEKENREEEKEEIVEENVQGGIEKLNPFDESQIKALISYYFFIDDMKKDLLQSKSKSKYNKYDCYLISYSWMQKYKSFYLYKELVEIIQKLLTDVKQDKIKREEIVYNNLNQNFIKKINAKSNSYPENVFEDINKVGFSSKELKKNGTSFLYPSNFEIISCKVYDQIQQRKSVEFKQIKKSYMINSDKIIIEIKKNKSFVLIIGTFDFESCKYNSELLFKYNDEIALNFHYDMLKNKSFNDYIKEYIKKDNIIENNKKVGEIYEINEEPKNEIKDESNTSTNNEYANNLISKQNKNNIKFLFRLHFFLNKLKFELNNNNFKNKVEEKCYLIKKELIDMYIKFYKFDSIIKKHEEKIKQLASSNKEEELKKLYKSLMEKYQQEFINKDLTKINLELAKNKTLYEISSTQYTSPDFICYENCMLSNNSFENNSSNQEFKYIIIENKIILKFNNNINIGILDMKNNTFVPETIIKFETEDDSEEMIQKMINYGISDFESSFSALYKNSNNSIFSLKSNNESKKIDIKINNFFESKKDNSNEKIFNTADIKKKMLLKKAEVEEKNKKQSLINIISLMIDTKIIKRKISQSLKEAKQEQYYLLNYEWFKKYIQLKNMTEIFNYLNDNKIVESYINDKNEENITQNKSNIISEIMINLGNEMKNKISNPNNYPSTLSNIKLQELSKAIIIKAKNDYIFFFKNFLLLSPETKQLFLSEFYQSFKIIMDCCPVYFGDDKIFLIIQSQSENLIEMGTLNVQNIFQPTIIFEHKYEKNLNKNIKLLTSNGYTQYTNYYLLFNEDYISPIFDQNNNRIGKAYRYDETKNDYSEYISQEEKMMCIIKIYLSNYKLKTKFNEEVDEKHYLIINEKYLKEDEDYTLIENKLNQMNLSNDFNNIMNSNNKERAFGELIKGKKFSLIIKSILSDKDNNSNQSNKGNKISVSIPELVSFSCNGTDFFYYNNFRLIEFAFHKELEDKNIQLNKNLTDNIVKCQIIQSYILIDITNSNNNNKFNYILEICEINEQNIINPIFLLAYYESDYFKHHLKYIFQNLNYTFQNFLENFNFGQGNGIPLSIEGKNCEINVGFIYKISNEIFNQNQFMPNNISINNSNVNIINNYNPNININISNNPSLLSNVGNIGNMGNNFNNFNQGQNQNINNDLIPDKKNKDSIDNEIFKHPSVGLKNVGATCYMNATLQCFCNIKKFVNFFKYKLNEEMISKINSKIQQNLTISFKYLIENLWVTKINKYYIPKYNSKNANNKYFIPKKFKEKISIMNPLFEGAQANDSKDLVNFLIMTLHEELNKARPQGVVDNSNISINQGDKLFVLQNFANNFMKENMSLISDLFYAMSNNTTECLNCHNLKYNFQIYFFLNFPLEEVRKCKVQAQVNQYIQANQSFMMMNQALYQQNLNLFMTNCNNNTTSVNLDDCFRYNQKFEEFTGENAMYCNCCQAQASARYQTLLSTGPEILILILNRGKGIEFKVKCEFVQQLNLYEYIEMKNTGFMYDLVGVVTHMGGSDSSGHFIAICKSPIDHCWYQYNDDLVFPVKDFVNEVINYAMPYILFYQKINN